MSWEEFMDRPLLAVERWKAFYRVERQERDSAENRSGMKGGKPR